MVSRREIRSPTQLSKGTDFKTVPSLTWLSAGAECPGAVQPLDRGPEGAGQVRELSAEPAPGPVQYSTVQYSTVQYSTQQYSTVHSPGMLTQYMAALHLQPTPLTSMS